MSSLRTPRSSLNRPQPQTSVIQHHLINLEFDFIGVSACRSLQKVPICAKFGLALDQDS
jgi:hypothetical protein